MLLAATEYETLSLGLICIPTENRLLLGLKGLTQQYAWDWLVQRKQNATSVKHERSSVCGIDRNVCHAPHRSVQLRYIRTSLWITVARPYLITSSMEVCLGTQTQKSSTGMRWKRCAPLYPRMQFVKLDKRQWKRTVYAKQKVPRSTTERPEQEYFPAQK